MADNLKGITIKIGGDTTELNKSLSDINSKTRSVQSELRQVDKLLKLNPNNVTMLKQKMELLTDSIQKSKQKLGIYESELEKLNAKIKANGHATDEDKEKQRKLERQIEKTKQEINKYEHELEQTNSALKNVDKHTGTVTAKNKQMGTSFKTAGATAKGGWSSVTTGINQALGIAQTVLSVIQTAVDTGRQIGEFFVGTTKKYTQMADDFNTLATSYGVSVETLQEWNYAAPFVDTDYNTIANGLVKITRSMNSARKGTTSATDTYDKLGVTLVDNTGKYRQTEEVLYDVIDALGSMEDETLADMYAQDIFGRSFQDLLPLVSAGSKGLKEFGKEARDMGLILDQETIDKMVEANDAFDRLEQTFALALFPIAEALAPVLEDVAEALTEILADPSTKEMLSTLGEGFGDIIKAIFDAFKEIDTKQLIQDITEAIPPMIEAIVDLIKFMTGEDGQKLADFIVGFVEFIGGFAQFIEGFAWVVTEALPKIFMGIFGPDGTGYFATMFMDTFGPDGRGVIATEFMNIFGPDGRGAIATKFMDIFGPDGRGIIATNFMKVFGPEGFFAQLFKGIADFFGSIFGNGGTISNKTKETDNVFAKMFGYPNGILWTKISNFGKAIGTFFGSIFGEGGTISQSLSKVGDFFKNTFGIPNGTLWSSIGDFFKSIGNKFSSMFDNVHIKLPHFNIKGKFSLDPLQIPTLDVKWYKKGGIFNNPSLIGVGEAGPEAVLPIEKLSGIIQGVFENRGISNGNNYTMNVYAQNMTDDQQTALFNRFNRFVVQKGGY